MKYVLAVAAALAVSQGPNYPAGPNLVRENMPPVPMELADAVDRYAEFRTAEIASWHPVKREMLMTTRFCSTEQVHHIKMPGGARKQLTFYNDHVSSGTYQPTDGNYFVFHKDSGGDEFFQLYRYDLQQREITLLTDGKSRNTGGTWSTKGDRIAYGSTRRNGSDIDLYVLNPLHEDSDRCVAQVNGGGWLARDWSPDDKTILAEEEVSANESYLWLFNVETGEKRLLTPGRDKPKASYSGGQISPDGNTVYTITDRDAEWNRLTAIEIKTGAHHPLTTNINWDIDELEMSRDGRYLAYTSNENGYSVLRIRDLQTGSNDLGDRLVELPIGICGGLRWHNNNKELAFSLETTRSPSNIYSIDVRDWKLVQWTDSETGTMDTEGFAEPELVKWKSFDNREMSGFLYKPPAKFGGKRPVVINIHGGPEGQFRPRFMGRTNYYINELGIAHIFPNIRGSSGYGKTFLEMDNGYKRTDSYKDIKALLDWIRTREDLDADRVMITGTSYGGHMALAISALYSDQIRCARDVVGISNLVTFLEHTQGYRRDLRRAEYGDERDPKMRSFLEKIAPMNRIETIKKPLFVVQGKNDPRVPISESDQMVTALKKQGTPVWYLVATDEGHGFSKKNNNDYLYYATALFMEEFLLR